MQDLKRVHDTTLLSKNKVYQINGRLYKFLYQDPYSRIGFEQYIFEPLNGQKLRADLKLNRNKVTRNVYELPGIKANSTVNQNHFQMNLF
ncbi:hypothetical protein SD81_040295 [Tolypothrix campylonemoides VB511288]|nr:hypothetical protein SD81_040295 [Tolypothrix campylonemoides VB511288]